MNKRSEYRKRKLYFVNSEVLADHWGHKSLHQIFDIGDGAMIHIYENAFGNMYASIYEGDQQLYTVPVKNKEDMIKRYDESRR